MKVLSVVLSLLSLVFAVKDVDHRDRNHELNVDKNEEMTVKSRGLQYRHAYVQSYGKLAPIIF